MYCPKCGASVADNNKKCPLCQTPLPDLGVKMTKSSFYPDVPRPRERRENLGRLFLVSLCFFVAGALVFTLDLIQNAHLTHSFFVLWFLGLFYASFLLPRWFRRPNPVIFFPIAMTLLLLFLLSWDLRTQGGWFLSFAFPLVGGLLLSLETVVVLLYYVKKGKLYIYGGLFLFLGVFSLLVEILYRITFSMPVVLTYSILPLILFSALGLGLLVIAVVGPFRRSFEKKFFI